MRNTVLASRSFVVLYITGTFVSFAVACGSSSANEEENAPVQGGGAGDASTTGPGLDATMMTMTMPSDASAPATDGPAADDAGDDTREDGGGAVDATVSDASVSPIGTGAQTVRAYIASDGGLRELCNSAVFDQVPGYPDLYIGRRQQVDPYNETGCQEPAYDTLSLFKMDETQHVLLYQQDILPKTYPQSLSAVPVTVNGSAVPSRLNSAYDPSVAEYHGVLWVAFECGGGDPNAVPSQAYTYWPWHDSSCIGALDPVTWTIDPARITVIAHAHTDPDAGFTYQAAIPKIFVFQNTPYIYWASIRDQLDSGVDGAVGFATTKDSTMRGMQLTVVGTANGTVMWGLHSGNAPVNSEETDAGAGNPPLSQQVTAVGADDRSNTLAVIFDVTVTDAGIYATGSVGGGICHVPLAQADGCFRMEILKATKPLGTDAFNMWATSPSLPVNPAAYMTFYDNPDAAGGGILGNFFAPFDAAADANVIAIPSNAPLEAPNRQKSFPIDLSSLTFSNHLP